MGGQHIQRTNEGGVALSALLWKGAIGLGCAGILATIGFALDAKNTLTTLEAKSHHRQNDIAAVKTHAANDTIHRTGLAVQEQRIIQLTKDINGIKNKLDKLEGLIYNLAYQNSNNKGG